MTIKLFIKWTYLGWMGLGEYSGLPRVKGSANGKMERVVSSLPDGFH